MCCQMCSPARHLADSFVAASLTQEKEQLGAKRPKWMKDLLAACDDYWIAYRGKTENVALANEEGPKLFTLETFINKND